MGTWLVGGSGGLFVHWVNRQPHDEPRERVMTGFDPVGYSVEIAQGRRGQDGAMWNKGKPT